MLANDTRRSATASSPKWSGSKKYLDRLSDDIAFPLSNAAQALKSQRRSGYRITAAAAHETVDNAMEAGATRIDVCFGKPKQLKRVHR